MVKGLKLDIANGQWQCINQTLYVIPMWTTDDQTRQGSVKKTKRKLTATKAHFTTSD